MSMNSKVQQLIDVYKSMSEKALQEEIDDIFDVVFAMLEAQECDSMESYPNPDIKIRISCDVIKNESGFYN